LTIHVLLQKGKAAGLVINHSDSGGLTWTGNRATAEKWLPVLRERKAEIVTFLSSNPPKQPDEGETIKQSALATGTDWKPDNPFFLRSHVFDASMDETYLAFWMAILHYGNNPGTTPEMAMRFAVDDCRRRRERRGQPGRLFQ